MDRYSVQNTIRLDAATMIMMRNIRDNSILNILEQVDISMLGQLNSYGLAISIYWILISSLLRNCCL